MDCVWRYRSPLGDVTLSSDGEALTGLWFDGQLHFGRTLAPQYGSCALPVFERAAAWLDCYFGGGRPDFEVPLQWRDTPFREAVWALLRTIPYGEVVTYGEMARELARRQGVATLSAQAVGGFGATVASMFSWQETFHWFGIIGIAYAVVLIFFLHENRGTRQSEAEAARPKADLSVWRSFGLLLSNIAFWVVLFYFASSSLPGWATKNWLPTLFADSLGVPMSAAGPISTFTIAFSSFLGVMIGGPLSDRWVKRNLRGRIYTSAIGLGLMVPALVLLGLGHGMYAAVGAGLCFGVGFGMFDTNNMPILCQFVPVRLRATAYGIMNMTGVFAGAACTEVLGRWADGGNLGLGFALLGGVIAVALFVQLSVLRPTTDNME